MAKSTYHHGNLRSALLASALEDLEENGVEALSLRKIARKAGVSHAAPAHHFGDARGLVTALTAEGFRLFASALATSREKANRGQVNILTAVGVGYVEFALAHPALFSLMFSSMKPDFDDADLDAASMLAFQAFLEDVGSDPSHTGTEATGVNPAAMKAWSTVHGLAVLLLSGRMRSVLSLPAHERTEAIRQILELEQ